MNGQAGKGPELRKGANLQAYWNNYDNIFRKDKEEKTNEDTDTKNEDVVEEYENLH